MTTEVMQAHAGRSVTQVVQHLRGTFATGRTREVAWRIEQLKGIERLCFEREAELSRAVGRDLERLPVEAWAAELATSRAEASYARRHLRSWTRRRFRPSGWDSCPAQRGCNRSRWGWS